MSLVPSHLSPSTTVIHTSCLCLVRTYVHESGSQQSARRHRHHRPPLWTLTQALIACKNNWPCLCNPSQLSTSNIVIHTGRHCLVRTIVLFFGTQSSVSLHNSNPHWLLLSRKDKCPCICFPAVWQSASHHCHHRPPLWTMTQAHHCLVKTAVHAYASMSTVYIRDSKSTLAAAS